MHWTTIITALALSSTFSFLVLSQGWSLANAFLVVGGSAAVLILGLLCILMIMAGRASHADLVREIFLTMRRDFEDLLRCVGIRR